MRSVIAAATALVAAVALLAGCGSGQPAGTTSTYAGASAPAGSWADANGDLANTRDAAGSRITAANVAGLKEAWTFKLSGAAAQGVKDYGSLAAAPIVVNGVVYLQDLDADVYAISLATGKLRWEYQVSTPEKSGPGPDGVAVAGGVVYGDSSSTVFALDAATGKVLWNDGDLLNSGQGSFEIQPAVAAGRVYLASAYGSGPGGGVILALSAGSGAVRWRFNTVTGSQASGVKALGVGSGGAWETPLVSADGSSVTFGTGNPYQSIGEAISHPSRQLYTDSEVNLSAATGKVEWDTKVADMPLGAATVSSDLVFTTLYNGTLIALNRATGAIVYQRKLPTSTNSPIVVTSNAVLVPAGGPVTRDGGGSAQLVAYSLS